MEYEISNNESKQTVWIGDRARNIQRIASVVEPRTARQANSTYRIPWPMFVFLAIVSQSEKLSRLFQIQASITRTKNVLNFPRHRIQGTKGAGNGFDAMHPKSVSPLL